MSPRMSGGTGWLLLVLLNAIRAAPLAAQQDGTEKAATPDLLRERVDQLDQQVRILSRRWELYQDSVVAAAQSRPVVQAGAGGFQPKSADGNFVLHLGGYLQADGRFFADDQAKTLTNDLLIRRARPVLEATVYRYYFFRLLPDFTGTATTLYDAWFEARFRPQLAIRAGKFKPAIDLERLQSATDIKFVERGLPTNLAPRAAGGADRPGEKFIDTRFQTAF